MRNECWVDGCTQTVTLICRDRNDREWLVCTDCGEQLGWTIIRPHYSMVSA